ncbi:penicillin-binding protein [Candidatus Gottesmanbacteria bacterium]|nr:penicillin-binding protein [Candidatus Gottesmanbacteria bacterium]
MRARSKKHKKPEVNLSRRVIFFVYLAYLLVVLGDGVRVAFRWIIRGLIVSYKKISVLLRAAWINMRVAVSVRMLSLKQRVQRVTPPSPPLIIRGGRGSYRNLMMRRRGRGRPRQFRLHPILAFFLGSGATIFFLVIPLVAYLWLRALPNPQLLSVRDIDVTTKVFDRNGVLLYEIYADQNRTPLALADIPKYVIQATIAIEDQNFYSHQGFSVRGIARAARETFVAGRVQGGSTITQQLIKSALLTPEVTISRKIKEIVLAFWAERLYTKDQILEMYLNQVPYGGTAWGIESAAQTYFGKSAKTLTLAEAAILAGLPAAPSQYSPFGHVDRAFSRQREVLRRMTQDRYIRDDQAREALGQEIRFATPRVGIRAPHFVMYIKELLETRYGPRLVERGGLRIKTSLDLGLQERVEDIVRTNVDRLTGLRVGNGAALVTNPKTGEILAMVGSRDYFDAAREGNVNVTVALRQPGSAIKVVTYATALEKGFTAASILDDSPVSYPQIGSPVYAPVNYDSKFHGFVPLRYALGNSYNIPAVKTIASIGVPAVIDKGRAMGITSWIDENRYGLSLTLGGGDITMLDMAKVFGTLANLGTRVDLLPVVEVSDYTGKVLERNQPKEHGGTVKPEVAWILGNMLSDNNARTAAFGPNSLLVIPGKTVSVKTGTSNDKRDNWTIGYTPSVVAAVWVGNNNNAPMDPYLTSGVTGAAPIWHDIMVEILKDRPDEALPRPEGVVAVPCYYGRPEYFVRGTQPATGQCAPLPTPRPSESPTPTP